MMIPYTTQKQDLSIYFEVLLSTFFPGVNILWDGVNLLSEHITSTSSFQFLL
jgi:hypothetical protein